MNITEYLRVIDETIENGTYKDSWESLCEYGIPEWYKKSKLGIFSALGRIQRTRLLQ